MAISSSSDNTVVAEVLIDFKSMGHADVARQLKELKAGLDDVKVTELRQLASQQWTAFQTAKVASEKAAATATTAPNAGLRKIWTERAAAEEATMLKQRNAFEKSANDIIRLTKGMDQELKKFDPLARLSAGMEKFKTVFIRVKDALLSFLVLNAVSTSIRTFFHDIIASNAQIETMGVRLQAIGGTSGYIAQLQRTILDLTVTTPFVIKDFMEAAVQIEAFGLKAQKYLPAIADWASAIGRPVQDIAVAFSKIAIGSPRTTLMLTTRGITRSEFDSEFRRTQNAAEALANVIERKFGSMAKMVSGTFQGLVSNVQDAWFQVAMVIGKDVFESMKADVGRFYDMLMMLRPKAGEDPGWMVKGLSLALDGLYNTLKNLLPVLLAFVTLWSMKQIYAGAIMLVTVYHKLDFAMQALTLRVRHLSEAVANHGLISQRTATIIGTMGSAFMTFGTIIVTAAYLYIDYFGRMSNATEALADAWKMLGDRSIDTATKIMAMQDAIRKGRDATSLTQKGLLAATFFAGPTGMMAFFPMLKQFLGVMSKTDAIEKRLGIEQKLEETRKESLKTLREMADVFSVLEFGKSIQNKVGADREVKLLTDQITAQKALTAARFNSLSTNEQYGDKGNELVGIYNSLDIGLQALNSTMWSEAETQAEVNKEMDKGRAIWVSALGNLKNGDDIVKSLQERFSHFPTDKVNKYFEDLSAKIAGALEQLRAMLEGYPQHLAKAQGAMAKMESLSVAIVKVENTGLKTKAQRQAYDKLELEYLETTIKFLNEMKLYNDGLEAQKDKIFKQEQKNWELTHENQRKAIEYRMKSLEEEADATANLNYLYEARALEMKNINGLLAENTDKKEDKERELSQLKTVRMLYMTLGLNYELGELQLQIAETEGELGRIEADRTDIMGTQLDLIKKQRDMAKLNLGEAFDETFRKYAKAGWTFFNEVADATVGAVKTFFTSIINDFLDAFTKADETTEQLYKLHAELSKIYADQRQSEMAMNRRRRGEFETNEAYLARMASLEQIEQTQAVQYEFQTKEMELLAQINKLEQERNNILLDRMKTLGGSIFDKILDKSLDLLIGGLFKTGGGGGFGGFMPSPNLKGGIIPFPTDSGRSVMVNLAGANIYGFDDFSRAVDKAVAQADRRRSA
jgi:hypothetical protein